MIFVAFFLSFIIFLFVLLEKQTLEEMFIFQTWFIEINQTVFSICSLIKTSITLLFSFHLQNRTHHVFFLVYFVLDLGMIFFLVFSFILLLLLFSCPLLFSGCFFFCKRAIKHDLTWLKSSSVVVYFLTTATQLTSLVATQQQK